MAREQVRFWWDDDDDVCFVIDQQAELDVYSASSSVHDKNDIFDAILGTFAVYFDSVNI
jgi:hypothetical protein